MSLLIGLIISILAYAVLIWIVSKLNLGLTVDSFVSAIIAAVVIAIVGAVIYWLLGLLGLSLGGGWVAAIIELIIAAVILMIADRFLSGMKVAGFVGALIAAIAIGVVRWIIEWLVSLFF